MTGPIRTSISLAAVTWQVFSVTNKWTPSVEEKPINHDIIGKRMVDLGC